MIYDIKFLFNIKIIIRNEFIMNRKFIRDIKIYIELNNSKFEINSSDFISRF